MFWAIAVERVAPDFRPVHLEYKVYARIVEILHGFIEYPIIAVLAVEIASASIGVASGYNNGIVSFHFTRCFLPSY